MLRDLCGNGHAPARWVPDSSQLFDPEGKMETTKDTQVHENQRVENLTARIFQVWMGLPSRG
jgi:hypothetical protein